MGKKRKKNSLSDVRNLDASSFLKRYYGISHKDIEHMTHEAIKTFFPQLQRTSFEYVQKNPELVSTGQIILVEDAKHYKVPYFTPSVSSLDDIFLGCDDREHVIQEVVKVFETSLENNLNALFIIACEDALEPYAFQPRTIPTNILKEDCLPNMMEATSQDSGIIIREDYSLLGYRLLSHGDNYYDTMILPPLQRQAVGISKRTDAIGVFYEDGLFGITIGGDTKELSTKEELQKELMALFPIPKEKETERETVAIVYSPSSYSLNEMSVYELEQLMRVYRASNQTGYYHTVRRELVKRTKNGKEYKFEKAKQKMLREEEDYND